jgi:hypothetical protein
MAEILPKTTVERKKTRFFVPLDHWFSGEFGEIAKQFLDEETVKKRGFKYSYIQKMIKEQSKSRIFYGRQLWNLLTYEFWYRIFIEGDPEKPKLKMDDLYD